MDVISGDQQLYLALKDNIEKILYIASSVGWGLEEMLNESYYDLPWIDLLVL